MNIPFIFFVCVAITIIGFVTAIINALTAISRVFKTGNTKSVLIIHVIAGFFYVVGGICTVGFGIAWIVTYLKH